MVAALGLAMLTARWLLPTSYGVYAFVTATLLWVANFSEIGIFSAASRLLARSEDVAEQRRLLGGVTVVAVGLFLAFGVVIAAVAPVVGIAFRPSAESALLVAAPVAGGLALELAVLYLCQGVDRPNLLVLRNVIARPVALGIVLAAHYGGFLSVSVACFAFAMGSSLAALAVFLRLDPAVREIRASLSAIRCEARRAKDGAMYVGRVIGSSLYNMDRLLIGYVLTAADVGYYALAFSLAAPVTLGAQSLATVSYRQFVQATSIPRRLWYTCLGWLIASSVIGYVAIHVFITAFLPKYAPALPLVLPALLTADVLGVIALMNQFLSAHGRGRELRRISLAFAFANLTLYSVIIPVAGIEGAAYVSLGTAMVPLVGNAISYRRLPRATATSSTTIEPGAAFEDKSPPAWPEDDPGKQAVSANMV